MIDLGNFIDFGELELLGILGFWSFVVFIFDFNFFLCVLIGDWYFELKNGCYMVFLVDIFIEVKW